MTRPVSEIQHSKHGKEYSRPEIISHVLMVEGGFCMSSQLRDFEENRIYVEEF